MSGATLYAEYKAKMQKIADVKYAAAVLQWDQETYLPEGGAGFRGQQIATLEELAHQLFTDKALQELLLKLNDRHDLSEDEQKNVELSLYDYEKKSKLSSAFVRQQSEAINQAYHAWVEARKAKSFSPFEKPLSIIVDLKKQEADLLGYEAHPYDALMNEYDRGATVAATDNIFSSLLPKLSELLNDIKLQPQLNNLFLHQHFDKDEQWNLGIELLKHIGFDFTKGRQDISIHPFTTNFNCNDVRITTRIDENDFSNMVWSCLHEGGHALYEQGLPEIEYGLPLGEYTSLSIHESQSRLWENCVGRGINFWQHNFSQIKTFFNNQLGSVSVDDFFKGINRVEPSFIRTEADELTYHFHVYIRYEIEKQLIEGTISVSDIPDIWNAMYKQHLGVTVSDILKGCLQDIHWSHGSFGYFATYSLGSLYAAQFYETMVKQHPNLEQEIDNGDCNYILQWTRKNIHQHGRKYTSDQICNLATGENLNPKHFFEYAKKKFSKIYGI